MNVGQKTGENLCFLLYKIHFGKLEQLRKGLRSFWVAPCFFLKSRVLAWWHSKELIFILLEHLHKILPKPQVCTSWRLCSGAKATFSSAYAHFSEERRAGAGLHGEQPCSATIRPQKVVPANAWTRTAPLKRELRWGSGVWSDSHALVQCWVTCCRADFSRTKHWGLVLLTAPCTPVNCLMGQLGFWVLGGGQSRDFKFFF